MLNPNLAVAHQSYSHLLCIMGRGEEALRHMELALELDPLNPMCHAFYGIVLLYHRRSDDALAAIRTALDIEPNHKLALSLLAKTLGIKGMHDKQLALIRKFFAYDAEFTAALEAGFKEADYQGAYRALADLMAEWYEKPGKRAHAGEISELYLSAGDYDLAIDWFEKTYEKHDPSLRYLGLPQYDPLRSDPRFQDLLRKMNLPTGSK
jgi:tetratricopeptide (TPR) repeat protein